jgi:hypothetical protein
MAKNILKPLSDHLLIAIFANSTGQFLPEFMIRLHPNLLSSRIRTLYVFTH